MIVCPNCQHRNDDTATHCAQCGHAMDGAAYRVCASCGALNPIENLFCHRCLGGLAGPLGASSQEGPEESSALPIASVEAAQPAVTGAETDADDRAAAETTETQSSEGAESDGPTEEPGPMLPDLGENPLEGLPELLPLETAIALPHRATPPPSSPSASDEQQEADLFAALAAEPAPLSTATLEVLAPQKRDLPRGARLVLCLALLLVACVPLLSPGFSGPVTTLSAETRQMLGALTALSSDAQVLVAVDYGPSHAGELDPVAHLLLEQIVSQGAELMVMSTQPEGIGMAQRLLRSAEGPLGEAVESGQATILGLLPGQEMGLRLLMRSLDQAFRMVPAVGVAADRPGPQRTMGSIGEFDQVLILCDDSRTIRAWIEQAPQGIAPLAVVTAQVQPVLLPYRQAGQLGGLVSGATAAIELQDATAAAVAPAGASDGLIALFILVVLVAIAANVARVAGRKGTQK